MNHEWNAKLAETATCPIIVCSALLSTSGWLVFAANGNYMIPEPVSDANVSCMYGLSGKVLTPRIAFLCSLFMNSRNRREPLSTWVRHPHWHCSPPLMIVFENSPLRRLLRINAPCSPACFFGLSFCLAEPLQDPANLCIFRIVTLPFSPVPSSISREFFCL